MIILGERHLLRVLREYAFAYFSTARPHQGIEQQVSAPTDDARANPAPDTLVTARPVLGGLNYDYRVAS